MDWTSLGRDVLAGASYVFVRFFYEFDSALIGAEVVFLSIVLLDDYILLGYVVLAHGTSRFHNYYLLTFVNSMRLVETVEIRTSSLHFIFSTYR